MQHQQTATAAAAAAAAVVAAVTAAAAAAALDSRRNGKSLAKFMDTLKAADPATLKRKRD
jgi:hypothetical protein